jgi:hypothetical protein
MQDNRLKILLVSRTFHPAISPRSFRATELAIALRDRGHQVTVAVPRDYASTFKESQFSGMAPIDLGPIKWKDISTSHANKLVSLAKRFIRRSLNLAFEYPDIQMRSLVSRSLSRLSGFDMAISIAAPHSIHWGFARARKLNPSICKTWVADCGDPFIGLTTDTFRKPFYFSWLEKDFCRRADFITIPIEAARKAYFSEFHPKIKVIPQGFRLPQKNELPRYQPNSTPTFIYCGGFLPRVRDPRPLLDLLYNLQQPFHFICHTWQREFFEDFEDKLAGRLSIRPYLPRDRMLKELARADFLLNLENPTDIQTPSKLIDYAIAQRPILSINSQTIDKSVVEEFLNGDYSRKAKVPEPSFYDINHVASQFESLFDGRDNRD